VCLIIVEWILYSYWNLKHGGLSLKIMGKTKFSIPLSFIPLNSKYFLTELMPMMCIIKITPCKWSIIIRRNSSQFINRCVLAWWPPSGTEDDWQTKTYLLPNLKEFVLVSANGQLQEVIFKTFPCYFTPSACNCYSEWGHLQIKN
jgi:hypothetical protein